MISVRITAIRKANYPDLQKQYENPIAHACEVQEGQSWVSDGWNPPADLCPSAWESIATFVRALGAGGGDFYDGWMQDPRTAMISCNDGFRPVSFLLEAMD